MAGNTLLKTGDCRNIAVRLRTSEAGLCATPRTIRDRRDVIDTPQREWLLIDCSRQGEVRLAHAKPGLSPDLKAVLRYETTIPTFTDVLLRYSRDSGHQLVNLQPVVAIAGVPVGPSTIIERSRWVISRDGLTSLFAQAPIIINEVAAQAWAARGSLQGVTLVHGQRLPDLQKPGRYVFFTYEEGVGTAIVNVDEQGRTSVLDAEGGQLDFAAASESERALARLVTGSAEGAMSWEKILMLRRSASVSAVPDPERVFARLLCRFASNLIYTSGAWDGVFMAGPLLPGAEVLRSEFSAAFTTKRPYARLLTKAAALRVTQSDAVLRGCAVMMASTGGHTAMS